MHLMFTGKHLYVLNYPGGSKLNLFRNQWIHILSAMREDDKPRDLALRDILFDKIKGSSSMAFDLRHYRSLPEGDTNKSYEYVKSMMARTVAVEREEENRLDKAKGVNQIIGSKALAVENNAKKDDKPKPTPKTKAESAAPVLPKPHPKMHHNEHEKGKGKYGKGQEKGKGKDKSRGRSPSQDRKSIPCIYHFQKGGCSKGKDCPYSHSKRKAPRGSNIGPGMVKEVSQRMTVHLLLNTRVRNHVSCMLRGNVIELIVLTNMITKQLLLKAGQRKLKRRLPKGKPKRQRPKPKVRR